MIEQPCLRPFQKRLTSALGTLTGKGRLSEKDIEVALRQVRMALLEADVDFKVARSFVSKVRDEAHGEQVVKSLTPGQTVVKIVQDNLVEILGGDSAELQRGDTPPSVIMLVGLQGAGKTTAAAKLALHIRREWKQDVMLAACDLQRPAAVEQLVTLGKQIGAPVYNENPRKSTPLKVAKNAFDRAQRDQTHWLILDTAGRLAIDDELMSELEKIKSNLSPIETFLVVDAMTGQDAVNSGSEFNRRIGLTGMLLTKMDGDARGGAALSMKSVTGLPVKFVGVGERPEQLEAFHPERMAQRILGMGDVTTLIEKAQREIDEDEAKRFEHRLRRNEFDLNDMLEQFRSIRRMGPLSEVLGMIPGLGALRGSNSLQNVDERRMSQVEAIILSMTPQERTNPKIINGSRRRRVASGSGTSPSQVNQLLGQYRQMQKMMKRISGPGGERALQNMMRGMR